MINRILRIILFVSVVFLLVAMRQELLSRLAALPAQLRGRSAPTRYVVQVGDCLGCLAAKFGVVQQALIDANKDQYPSIAMPSGTNRLQAGWVLAIPASGQLPAGEMLSPTPFATGGTVGTGLDDPALQLTATPTGVHPAAVTPSLTVDGQGGYFDYAAAVEIVQLTNAERVKAGLRELGADETLMEIARLRAVDISTNFAHTRDRCAMCGENIIKSPMPASGTAAILFSNWMASEGHRANILESRASQIGVGVYRVNGKTYATQVFK